MTDAYTRLTKYLVGGYVRDKLLGAAPLDKDWVVVGATPEQMLALGFQQVGRDFPIFLHPQSKQEYALARSLRKPASANPESGLVADASVTLEQDLQRRDLTINAIAMDEDGNIIDPFHGVLDLRQGILRHVGSTFVEDPLRVVRLARFAANLGFDIAVETLQLARRIAATGQLEQISPERVWQEIRKALSGKSPADFIRVLHQLNALQPLLPQVAQLFGVPQSEKHHPEIDTGTHLLLALERAADLSDDPVVRFAVLVHDLGKGVTPKSEWPRHIAHEAAGIPLVAELCAKYRIPNRYCRLGKNTAAWHLQAHNALILKPRTLLRLFERLDVFRRPDELEPFLLACQSDAQGRLGFSLSPYPQADYLRRAFHQANQVSAAAVVAGGKQGQAVGDELHALRIRAIAQFKTAFSAEQAS